MHPSDEKQPFDPQLRTDAEARLADFPRIASPGRPAAELLHELHVHQIELEMQNESLRQALVALEDSRDRFVDFYEFAPVGYITLTDTGLISAINLPGTALLGMERGKALQRHFAQFVAPADQDLWHGHFRDAMQDGLTHACELNLKREDGTIFPARLSSLRFLEHCQTQALHIVLTDITESRRAEAQLREMTASLEATVAERTRELRRLAGQLTLTEERERRLLAQDLHDNLGQLLAVIKIKLNSLAAGSLQSPVNQIAELVGKAERSVRAITLELSPPILHTLGFVPALEWLVEEMSRVYGLTVHFDDERAPKPLVDEIQAMLYRSVRELLINVARHASLTVSLKTMYCMRFFDCLRRSDEFEPEV